mmetsp:Transcript_106205/g.298609  ORF Transcript_106205/g.298609 Transcript_106205/m.298609 type:complete len:204 (-) Transcript_106205:1754-2365(-)
MRGLAHWSEVAARLARGCLVVVHKLRGPLRRFLSIRAMHRKARVVRHPFGQRGIPERLDGALALVQGIYLESLGARGDTVIKQLVRPFGLLQTLRIARLPRRLPSAGRSALLTGFVRGALVNSHRIEEHRPVNRGEARVSGQYIGEEQTYGARVGRRRLPVLPFPVLHCGVTRPLLGAHHDGGWHCRHAEQVLESWCTRNVRP